MGVLLRLYNAVHAIKSDGDLTMRIEYYQLAGLKKLINFHALDQAPRDS